MSGYTWLHILISYVLLVLSFAGYFARSLLIRLSRTHCPPVLHGGEWKGFPYSVATPDRHCIALLNAHENTCWRSRIYVSVIQICFFQVFYRTVDQICLRVFIWLCIVWHVYVDFIESCFVYFCVCYCISMSSVVFVCVCICMYAWLMLLKASDRREEQAIWVVLAVSTQNVNLNVLTRNSCSLKDIM